MNRLRTFLRRWFVPRAEYDDLAARYNDLSKQFLLVVLDNTMLDHRVKSLRVALGLSERQHDHKEAA